MKKSKAEVGSLRKSLIPPSRFGAMYSFHTGKHILFLCYVNFETNRKSRCIERFLCFFSSLGNVFFYSDVLVRNNFIHRCCYCYFHSKTCHHLDFRGIKVTGSKSLANSHWFSQSIMKSIVEKTLSFFCIALTRSSWRTA